MDEIKKGWKIIVFSMLVSNIGFGAFAFFKSAASTEYVDKKDNELQYQLNQKADKQEVDKMSKQIDFIYQEALTRANRNK